MTTPDWAYSIGLWHSYFSVELCLLGIPQQRAMEIVNTVGRLIRDGQPLTPGRRLAGVIDGYKLDGSPGSLDPADYGTSTPGKSALDLADAELKLSAAAVLYARDARGARIDPARRTIGPAPRDVDPAL